MNILTQTVHSIPSSPSYPFYAITSSFFPWSPYDYTEEVTKHEPDCPSIDDYAFMDSSSSILPLFFSMDGQILDPSSFIQSDRYFYILTCLGIPLSFQLQAIHFQLMDETVILFDHSEKRIPSPLLQDLKECVFVCMFYDK